MTLVSEYKTTDLNLVEHGSSSGENAGGTPMERQSVGDYHSSGLDRYINFATAVNFGVIILASWESFAVTLPVRIDERRACVHLLRISTGKSRCMRSGLLTSRVGFNDGSLLQPGASRAVDLLSILANIITSLAIFNYENYVPERWHTSLIMIAIMLVPLISNLWFRKVLDAVEMIGGILHLCLFVVFIVVLIVFGPRNDSEFVFKTLTYETSGWNSPGVSWGLGLLSMTFSVTGADGILHMCDEVKKVRTRVPRSIIIAVTVNSALLIVFATILLFYMGPLDDIIDTPLPLLWVIYGITGSKTAANVLISVLAIITFLALFNIFASVSRLIWVFARDNGLPFSSFFAHLHPTLRLPVNALLLVGTIVTCLSLIYIASVTAFNALISLQAIAIHISYFFPILFILLRKLRGPTPPYGPFKMGPTGVPVNIFALCYIVYVVLWMPFPQILPVTKDNMNYAGPIFCAVVLGALGHWFIRARKTFRLPITRYE
ncbi:hypothetical protein SNOG_05944 [Parastagonospora nodorum SN15]|uniref:Amino acid permease/ SLC12A domain-containing protein n=1 Tax=Phaeosphaeria nodorum (strain SN15 / ATCC MYA-4574 / FGSC 10173) TaxID=321614 RepID=Q0UQM0_PHANO|nr:hypothetical protein SNOG_05944 [Parastagonospora nodorum SN15]EAT87008.1 hypothetical protein SNOG_05944 [Parastagonospora nodorum SN15]